MPSPKSMALLALSALSTLAAARPQDPKRWSDDNDATCMTSAQAQTVVDNWKELLVAYSDAAADEYVTRNFTDYSESVNTLINTCPQGGAAEAHTVPLLAATFNNRKEFKTGQGEQPTINFQQLQIWHTCDAVTARWKTTNTAPIPDPKPVVGIFVLEVVPGKGSQPFKIERAYSEFDAGAWLQNLQDGGICVGSTDPVAGGEDGAAPVDAPVVNSAVGAPIAAATTAPAYVAGTTAVPVADDTLYGNTTAI